MAVDENKANANSAAMRFLYMVFLDMAPKGGNSDEKKRTRRRVFRFGGVDVCITHDFE
jgi:hypothetical protein